MPRVMIKCPNTGKDVPVGMGFDRQSFESSTLVANAFWPCTACGDTHIWDKKDAFLEGSLGAKDTDGSDKK
jgi:hypothetical protein